MSKRGSIKTTQCPECDGTIVFGTKTKLGKSIECPECGVMLEVVSLNPLELDTLLETRSGRKRKRKSNFLQGQDIPLQKYTGK